MDERPALNLDDVCEELDISRAQMTTVIRLGELKAAAGAGRGKWSIEPGDFEVFIERKYAETQEFIRTHPYSGPLAPPRGGEDDGDKSGDTKE